MILRILVLLSMALSLGACSAKRCAGDNAYLEARAQPPLKSVEGFALPQEDGTYRIPEAVRPDPGAAPLAPAKVENRRDCLDFPPALPARESPADA